MLSSAQLGQCLQQAQTAYEKALSIWEMLALEHPEVPDYQQFLSNCQCCLGNLFRGAGRSLDAETSYQRALTVLERLVRTHPMIPEYGRRMAECYIELGLLFHATERTAEAEAALQKALVLQERLAREHPSVLDIAVNLGGLYSHMGNLSGSQKKHEAAMEWYGRAIRMLESALQKQPQHAAARAFLGDACAGRASAWGNLGRFKEAINDWSQAIELDTGNHREKLRLYRALTRARNAEHVAATAEANELASQESVSGDTLSHSASVFSICSATVLRDSELPESRRAQLSGQYAARAIELIRRARLARGLQDTTLLDQLKGNPDLEPLRTRDDFRELLSQWEMKN